MEEDKMSSPGLVAIGGSAGSLSVLLAVLPQLPSPLSFPIAIILHRKASNESALADLLSQKTFIPVKEIEDKDPILPGTIYLAPADYHLLIEQEKIFSLDYSEKVNYSRPSIDVTFQAAAKVYQNKLIAILLSGANADGTEGLKTVCQLGGRAIIQDPATAESPFMPKNALNELSVSQSFGPAQIASLLKNSNIFN